MLLLYFLAEASPLSIPSISWDFCPFPLISLLHPCTDADDQTDPTREMQADESYLQNGAEWGHAKVDLEGGSQTLLYKSGAFPEEPGVGCGSGSPTTCTFGVVDGFVWPGQAVPRCGRQGVSSLNLYPPSFSGMGWLRLEGSAQRPEHPGLLLSSDSSLLGQDVPLAQRSLSLWGREESVPWRNRIWVDARDKAWGWREQG